MTTVGHYLRNLKNRNVITCSPDDSIQTAAALMGDNKIGAMPVLDGENVIGMISERDIVRAFSTHSAALAEMKVSEFMTKEVITCDCSTPISSAMETMSLYRIRHLPVFKEGSFVGVISIGDTLVVQLQNLQLEANVLRDISIASRAR